VTRAGEAAELVLGVEDDMLEMPVERRPSNQVRVLDALSTRSARAAGHIATRSGLSLPATVAALGALEVEGVVRERDGQWLAVPRRG
jgi:DNA processing protein